jgi:hypothetical protein
MTENKIHWPVNANVQLKEFHSQLTTKARQMLGKHLKGHGNEAEFLGILQKLVPHRSPYTTFVPLVSLCSTCQREKV